MAGSPGNPRFAGGSAAAVYHVWHHGQLLGKDSIHHFSYEPLLIM